MPRLVEFAAELIALEPSPAELSRLTVHLSDTMGALRVSLTTAEGRALLRFAARHAAGDPISLAAGVASAIRLTEMDDINLPGCITASAAIVPAALAASEQADCSPERFASSLMQGYEAMVRLGVALGGARALGGVWPSLFAAPFGTAATAARALGLDQERTAHALALALSMTQGRAGQPVGKQPGRWFLFGDSVARGLRAAQAAEAGFSGDLTLLDGDWLQAASGVADADLLWFDRAEREPAAMALSIKPFCTARQAANAVVAFRDLLPEIGDVHAITDVLVEVPPIHAGMITRPVHAGVRMATVSNVAQQIAIAALAPQTLWDAERTGAISPERQALAARVRVTPNTELEVHLPSAWPARITVHAGGRTLMRLQRTIPGDPSEPIDFLAIQRKYANSARWEDEDAQLVAAAPAALTDRAARHTLWTEIVGLVREPA